MVRSLPTVVVLLFWQSAPFLYEASNTLGKKLDFYYPQSVVGAWRSMDSKVVFASLKMKHFCELFKNPSLLIMTYPSPMSWVTQRSN